MPARLLQTGALSPGPEVTSPPAWPHLDRFRRTAAPLEREAAATLANSGSHLPTNRRRKKASSSVPRRIRPIEEPASIWDRAEAGPQGDVQGAGAKATAATNA